MTKGWKEECIGKIEEKRVKVVLPGLEGKVESNIRVKSQTGHRRERQWEGERRDRGIDWKMDQRGSGGGDATDSEAESKECGNGWVKRALVPIKSHYSRLIMQGSCCFHRYKLWLRSMNNSAGKKDTQIQGSSGIRTGPCEGPMRQNAAGKCTS